MAEVKQEGLLDLVERLDKESAPYHWFTINSPDYMRLSRAVREMHARLEDHDCFSISTAYGDCPQCAFLARLDEGGGE